MSRLRERLAIAVLACLPFVPSLAGGFVYDDVPIVQEDPRVQEGDLRGAWTEPYWGERHGGLYRPVTTVSYVLEGLVTQEAWLFRATNLALHAGASLLALALARRLLGGRGGPAFVAAALFAVHPIHVEVAANVVGRGESLAFLLAGAGWFLVLDDEHRVLPRRIVPAALLACLGVLAKENGLAVALAAPLETLLLARGVRAWPRVRAVALAVLPAFVALVAANALRVAALGAAQVTPGGVGVHAMLNPLAGADFTTRLANAPVLFLWYLRDLCFPVALSPDYGGATLPLVADPLSWSALAWLLAALAWLVAPALLGGRVAAFGSLFFALALLPVLQLVPIGILAADRLAYAATFGFTLELGLLAGAARGERGRGIALWASAALVAGLALVSAVDAHAWADPLRLFARARTRSPESFQIPYVQGALRMRRGEDALAIEPLEAALARAPDDPEVLALLGQAIVHLGHAAEARPHLERALARGVRHERETRVQLGMLLEQLGDLPGAERELSRALELRGDDGELILVLARVERGLGRTADARAHVERALELGVPNEAAWCAQLGMLCLELGDLRAAEHALRRASYLQPDEPAWQEGLANVLQRLGDLAGARAALERFLELDSKSPRAEEIRRRLARLPP